YKELFAYLDGDLSLTDAVRDIVVRTQQYAVRQERWFRRDPRIRWIDIVADPVAEVTPVIQELLS
ncbi:MAG TPA: tRNA (adenosine(37)-N6)-dimethylallyltransferase MiaA, partial [Ilumatobacteraceae bacterium]|nr:tRNA (adenosine(37)-N6)-dimethylallyltransferase MiaA [Ilumatobacteraceae bacterium]